MKGVNDVLNKLDCTFYFIMMGESKTTVLKEKVQKAICKRLEDVAGVRFYGMRSGPDVRSSKALKEEFEGTIPEQVKIVLIDRKKDEIALLNQKQRDMFFEIVMESTEDVDTVTIVEHVLDEIEGGR